MHTGNLPHLPQHDAAIRPVAVDDVTALKAVIDETGLFPSHLLDGMLAAYLADAATDDVWLTISLQRPVALAYCAPEPLTQGTWNLYLIAVHPDHQGQGHGAALVQHLETLLTNRGARILLVETSGLPSFERTRMFYLKAGYVEEARISEFYQAGEDKVIFRKALSKRSIEPSMVTLS